MQHLPLLTPTRTTSTAPRCDKIVAGGGLMSYHCSLSQGHDQHPPEDPEPCYAVENAASTRRWSAWKHRQQVEAETEGASVITCPACHDGTMVVRDGIGVCSACGVEAQVQADLPRDPGIEAVAMPPASPPAAPETDDGDYEVGEVMGERPDGLADLRLGDRVRLANQQTKPTKQRPGDQRLPDGTEDCVQDLIIAEMEESKRVGVERYGQTLRTFNGRKGVQDVADEVRDLHVYLTQIRREAEATRDTLVQVVTRALEQSGLGITGDYSKSGEEIAAEVAVDRIMGWVVGNHEDLLGHIESGTEEEQAVVEVLGAAKENGASHRQIARALLKMLGHVTEAAAEDAVVGAVL